MIVLGYGSIGQEVAKRAWALGMRVIGVRTRACSGDEWVERVAGMDELGELFAMADFVVCVLPLTSSTRKLIDRDILCRMQPHAVFVNIGRGAVVDEEALEHLLRDRAIKGAVLDVFAQEPLPESSGLFELDNVLLSSHCADNTDDYTELAIDVFLRELDHYCSRESLTNLVDKKKGY